ncbi:hypothetical protein HDV00_010926 [Rhizophlyctis rosea]|nr:hypothetical protein HDV00_010926 [Rhizophlyctis rosea]
MAAEIHPQTKLPKQTYYANPEYRYLDTQPENFNVISRVGQDRPRLQAKLTPDELQRISADIGRHLWDIVRNAVGEASDKEARALVLDIISAETVWLHRWASLVTWR